MVVTNEEVQRTELIRREENARASARRQFARAVEQELGIADLQDELLNLPEQIRQNQEAVQKARAWVDAAREEVETAEANLMLEISAAIDPKTGKPAYGNDAARKAELARRKAEDPQYTNAIKTLREAEAALASEQTNLDLLVNRFSSIRHLTDLQAARLRLLAG